MDHPNTENNLTISLDSEFFLDKRTNSDENDSFITELFMTGEPELVINGNDPPVDEIHNFVVNVPAPLSIKKERVESPENVTAVESPEEEKQDWIIYKDKYFEDQKLLANYEQQLVQCKISLLSLQAKTADLEKDNKYLKDQEEVLQVQLGQKEAELKQFKNLVQKQISTEEEVFVLKKELADTSKAYKKLQKNHANTMELLNKKISEMSRYRKNYKRMIAQLIQCSEVLLSRNLLPLKQIKNLETFMETYKDISFDSDCITEDSSLSLAEKKSVKNDSTESSILSNGTPSKSEISSDEDLTKSCLNGPVATSGYLSSSNIESSTNIQQPSLHQTVSFNSKNIHSEVPKTDTHIFQVPFSPAKSMTENWPNESLSKSEIASINVTDASVDVENTDNNIINKIRGEVKVDDLSILSHMPASFEKIPHCDKIKNRKNDPPAQASFKNSNIIPKDISTVQSNERIKNILSHQTSSGFQPQIDKKHEDHNSSKTGMPLITGNLFQKPISPNLHFLSSAYTNDTFQLLHQGSSAVDYISNSDTKFTAVLLTIPKKSPRSSSHNNKDDYVLPPTEKRIKAIESLYNAAVKSEALVNKRILNSCEDKNESSVNDPFSYVCVQLDSQSGQVHLTSSLQNDSVSDNSRNPCLAIEESRNEHNLTNNLDSTSVFNKPCLSKEMSSEIMHEENLILKNVEQKDNDNQSFVSESCDVSLHKEETAKTSLNHDINENEPSLPVIESVVGNYHESSETGQSSEKEDIDLSYETNKPNDSSTVPCSLPASLENSRHLLMYPKSSEKSSAEIENYPDVSLTKQFPASGDQNGLKSLIVETSNKMLQSSENEANSDLNTCNSNNRTVRNKAIIDAEHVFENTNISSPKYNMSVDKNKSEGDMHPAAACDIDLQSSSPLAKNESISIMHSESAVSAFECNGTLNGISTSTPKLISVEKMNDALHFAVADDDNLSHVKQNLFWDRGFKSCTLDNSEQSKKELEKAMKHCSKSVVKSSSDKDLSDTVATNKELHNTSDSSTKNVLSADVELPAFKKRKFLNSPLKPFAENESVPTLSGRPPDCVETLSESSPEISDNFQSSVHLISETSMNKSYGVFNNNINFASTCIKEKNTMLYGINSIDIQKNMEEAAQPGDSKFLNVSTNKNDNDLVNISEKKKRKTKNKNKRKDKKMKKELSSSIGVCLKSNKNKNANHLVGTKSKNNLADISAKKKNTKNKNKKQKEIKEGSNSSNLKKNDAKNFKVDTEIDSDTRGSNKNTYNIPSLQDTITKIKERVVHDKPFDVQTTVRSNESSEEKETSAININQEKLSNKNNSTKTLRNSKKNIEKNNITYSNSANFKTDTPINSEASINFKDTCNNTSIQNTIIETKDEAIYYESFKVQAEVPSTQSSENKNETFALNVEQEKLANKNSLSVMKVSNNQAKLVEEDGKINSDNGLLSQRHTILHNPSPSSSIHVTASENIKTGLSLKEDGINEAPVYKKNSEDYNKVSTSQTSENIDNLDNSQTETHKVHFRTNSYQSDISDDDENPLVIAVDNDFDSISETGSDIEDNKDEFSDVPPANSAEENNEVTSSSEVKTTVKNKKKKRKNPKTPKVNKRKKTQSSCDEESFYSSCTIQMALDDVKKIKFEEICTNHSNYKLLLHKLISALINPANAPDTTSALYQIISFLSSSKSNPILSYAHTKDISVFTPPLERCVVEALIKTESKKKLHLQGLIPSAISALYYLILDKRSISKTGLGALCRIFTQLCKHTNNTQKPIKLSCDLLKEQHPLAPVLIASIVGTWIECFELTEQDHLAKHLNVVRIFLLSCICTGLQKKPQTVTSTDWKLCKEVFQLAKLTPLQSDIKETIQELLRFVIEPQSVEDEWGNDWACDIILIIAVNKGWTWTQEKLLDSVTSLLQHYTRNEKNERAFSLLIQLCADIGRLAPQGCKDVLYILSRLVLEEYEFDYVKKYTLLSFLKFLVMMKFPIPEMITEAVEGNRDFYQPKLELHLRRRCIGDATDLTENDIVIA